MQLASSLRTNTKIEELVLSGHPIGLLGYRAIGNLLALETCNVKRLAIGDESMKDEGLRALVGENQYFFHLQELDLEFRSLSSVSGTILQRLFEKRSEEHYPRKLCKMNLSRNDLRDEGLVDLFSPPTRLKLRVDFSNLISLDLSSNNLSRDFGN